MKNSAFRVVSMSFVALCGVLAVSGCTPAVQNQSVGTQKAHQVIKPSVSYLPLKNAVLKSESANMYRIKSTVQEQDGTAHTNYSLYGYVNLPNRLSVQVHENSFNISFYQQGQVAYADELGTWTQSPSVAKLNAYQDYYELVSQVMALHTTLTQMNKVYVDNEYCDVYRFDVTNPKLSPPPFLESLAGVTGSAVSTQLTGQNSTGIQYTFYVGQHSGYLREVQSQTINGVGGLGPIATSTDTTFFDINNSKLAKITVPNTLVKQLENKGS